MTQAMDFTSPSTLALASACTLRSQPDAPPSRFQHCAQVARLAMAHASTYLARGEGRNVLNRSGLALPADRDLALTNEWQETKRINFRSSLVTNAPRMTGFEQDWLESGDQVQATQRELRREGIPLAPPAD